MLCAACTDETPTAPCTACGEDPLLDGRYRLEHLLGRGASGVTWAATRIDGGELVAVKAVSLPPGLSDKERELVAREVEVLRQIDHPDIPSLLDTLQVRRGGGVRVQYLVQTFLPGRTLAEELAERRFSVADVREVLGQVLPVLGYLHALSPPVVHRDLKPANLMRRADGRIALIDFGSVKAALSDPDLGGSTVSGTFGYMAPEQFRGDADPRSDLYGLGAVAVALLTRQDPRTLLDHGGRLQWHDHASVDPGLTALLDDLLQADPAQRPRSAEEVLQRLAHLDEEPAQPPVATSRPSQPIASVPPAPPAMSPASPPTPANGPLTAAAAGIVLVAGTGVFFAMMPQEPPAVSPLVVAKQAVTCTDGPCRPPKSFALRDLALGMTVDEALAAAPELVDAEDIGAARIRPEIDPLNVDALLHGLSVAVPLPGTRLEVETLVADMPMMCTLSFAVSDTLSALDCERKSFPSPRAWHTGAERLHDALVDLHGPGDGRLDKVSLTTTTSWSWRGEFATISLDGTFTDLGGMSSGNLRLDVRTTAHDQVVEQAKAQAAQRRDEARREQQEAEAARQEALRDKVGGNGGL